MTAEPHDLDTLAAQLGASRQLETPPDWATQRAMALWPAQRAAAQQASAQAAPGWLRVLAELVQTSHGAPLALGLRGAGHGPRQWLLQADAHDIELRLRPDPQQPADRWELAGQVLGPQASGQLQLVTAHDPTASRSVTLDELGSFLINDLVAGEWQLTLQLTDRHIVLPPLTWPDDGQR